MKLLLAVEVPSSAGVTKADPNQALVELLKYKTAATGITLVMPSGVKFDVDLIDVERVPERVTS